MGMEFTKNCVTCTQKQSASRMSYEWINKFNEGFSEFHKKV